MYELVYFLLMFDAALFLHKSADAEHAHASANEWVPDGLAADGINGAQDHEIMPRTCKNGIHLLEWQIEFVAGLLVRARVCIKRGCHSDAALFLGYSSYDHFRDENRTALSF